MPPTTCPLVLMAALLLHELTVPVPPALPMHPPMYMEVFASVLDVATVPLLLHDETVAVAMYPEIPPILAAPVTVPLLLQLETVPLFA